MAYYYPRKEIIELMIACKEPEAERLASRIEQGDPSVFEDWDALENLYDQILERERQSAERFTRSWLATRDVPERVIGEYYIKEGRRIAIGE